MSVRRLAVLLAAAGLAATVLAGCEKPPPYASIFAAGDTASGEAVAWCFDGGSAAVSPLPSDCVQGPKRTGVLKVSPGDKVAIDVPTTATDDGWTANLLTDADGGQVSRVPGIDRDETYARFTVPTDSTASAYVLEVIALHQGGKTESPRGVWRFRLDVKGA
jgi:hypothetical protein